MAEQRLRIELAVLTGLGVLFGLLGPFGTFTMPWPWRLLDWLVFLLGGALFFRPVVGAARLLARHGAMPLPAAVLCACLLAAFPTTMLVACCLAGTGWRDLTGVQLAGLYPEVMLVGLVATAAQFAIPFRQQGRRIVPVPDRARGIAGSVEPVSDTNHQTGARHPFVPPNQADRAETPPVVSDTCGETGRTGTARPAAFLSRLPPALGRDLLCLENEDHYVRAHTACGSTLILMRLADAVSELDGIEGLRTHRSWWVARDAVTGIVRRDRTIALTLRTGIEAPVARAMAPVLRQAGWLFDGDKGRIATVPVQPI